MKFRKRPITVEAVQWKATKQSWDEIMAMGDISWKPGEMGSETFYITTLESDMKVSKDDWGIKGVAGEFCPCKPDIFEATYEPVVAA